MSVIPSPAAGRLFWIGNLCAPWLALAFVVGCSQSTRGRAAVAGIVTEVCCVFGFYAHFLFLGPTAVGLPEGTALSGYVGPVVVGWLHFTSYWLVAAVVAGLAYGLLGNWWKRSSATAVALAVGLPFLAEPVLWNVRVGGLREQPWLVWGLEATAGLLIVAVLLRRRPLGDADDERR
ncbi:MAG: hypothetical protein QOI42_1411 [Frankiaceae bacterium]|jgi:hypothetical protein|nr:hypothetical protein [Frankiaceae bacterium]